MYTHLFKLWLLKRLASIAVKNYIVLFHVLLEDEFTEALFVQTPLGLDLVDGAELLTHDLDHLLVLLTRQIQLARCVVLHALDLGQYALVSLW